MAIIKLLQSITLKNDNGEDTTYVVASAPAIVETTESASVASFADGAGGFPFRVLKGYINPVQSGSGDPSPSNVRPITGWTGMNVYRTGKNLFDVTGFVSGQTNTSGVPLSPAAYTISNGVVSISQNLVTNGRRMFGSIKLSPATYTVSFVPTLSGTNYTVARSVRLMDDPKSDVLPAGVFAVVNGQRASFSFTVTVEGNYAISLQPQNADSGTLQLTDIQLERSASATTYEPYAGTTYLTDWGINQWDEVWEVGTLNTDGTDFPSVTNIRSKNYIPVLGSTTYFIKSPYSSGIQIFEYTTDKTYIKRTFVANSTITLAQNAAFIRFRTPDGVTTYNNDISINYPSTETGYHKYADPHAGIVYGGTLNLVTGVLTVDMASVDLGTLTWYRGTNYFYSAGIAAVVDPPASGSSASIAAMSLSSTYAAISTSQAYSGSADGYAIVQTGDASAGHLWVVDSALMSGTEADFKTAMSGVQLVYALATPVTYQLTPQAVMTILGQNNIWADTGDVEVAYCADTKLYIDKVIAEL